MCAVLVTPCPWTTVPVCLCTTWYGTFRGSGSAPPSARCLLDRPKRTFIADVARAPQRHLLRLRRAHETRTGRRAGRGRAAPSW